MPTHKESGMYRGHASEPDDAYLKSVGEDSLTKAKGILDAALAQVADMHRRLDVLLANDAETAAADARSRREVAP